jgi:hypothetical protein
LGTRETPKLQPALRVPPIYCERVKTSSKYIFSQPSLVPVAL